MQSVSELQTLLERVKAAKGPDRELDVDIGRLDTSGPHRNYRKDTLTKEVLEALAISEDRECPFIVCPTYTASIVAALALVGRVLPGWTWRIVGGEGYAELLEVVGATEDRIGVLRSATAATPPLAILAALLSALIAQRSADENRL